MLLFKIGDILGYNVCFAIFVNQIVFLHFILNKIKPWGEHLQIKKLNEIQSYLRVDLERYQEIVQVPEAQKRNIIHKYGDTRKSDFW